MKKKPNGQPFRILVVDDEEEIQRLLEIELSSEGFEIIKAGDGREAIKKATISQPDLMIIDILMPNMDGSKAVSFLKADAATQQIAIIFLTGILKKDETNGVKIGEAYYPSIAKPFNHNELLFQVHKALSEI